MRKTIENILIALSLGLAFNAQAQELSGKYWEELEVALGDGLEVHFNNQSQFTIKRHIHSSGTYISRGLYRMYGDTLELLYSPKRDHSFEYSTYSVKEKPSKDKEGNFFISVIVSDEVGEPHTFCYISVLDQAKEEIIGFSLNQREQKTSLNLSPKYAKFLQVQTLGYQEMIVPLDFRAGSSHTIDIKLAPAAKTFQAALKAEYYTVAYVSGLDNNLPKGTIQLTPLKKGNESPITLRPLEE